jgi:hypothetical protein
VSETPSIQWVVRNLIGWKRTKKDEKESWTPGEVLATRANGAELLFAYTPPMPEPKEGHEDEPVELDKLPKKPLEWIPVGDFAVSPAALVYEDDLVEAEEIEIPRPSGPFGGTQPPVRRRGEGR